MNSADDRSDPTAEQATATNRTTWDEWTEVNYRSASYNVDAFLRGAVPGRQLLDALDADWLGDVDGLSLLHLQCHFGMDTLTQARRGARPAVGVDFSTRAIERARELAQRTGLDDRAEFLERDVLTLDLRQADGSPRRFDRVYTSHGVLGWLGDLERWAEVIARHLAPGGRFVLIEGHPFALAFDDTEPASKNGKRRIGYPYFPGRAMRLESNQVYSDPDALVESVTFEWSHSLSEIVGALLGAGLVVERLEEFPFCAWQMLRDLEHGTDGVWRQPEGQIELPLTFALSAAHRSSAPQR